MRIAFSEGEYAVSFDSGASARVLVLPALFDESNKLRRFTLGVMRAMANAGIDSLLADLPGTNESMQPLGIETLGRWRAFSAEVARRFGATHVLSIRGGALVDPGTLPTLAFAPVAGASLLRAMLRAAVLGEREAGREVTRDDLLAQGLRDGLVLGGHSLSATMLAELEAAEPCSDARQIAQSELGGPALWLRAEPDDDPAQAVTLAEIVAGAL